MITAARSHIERRLAGSTASALTKGKSSGAPMSASSVGRAADVAFGDHKPSSRLNSSWSALPLGAAISDGRCIPLPNAKEASRQKDCDLVHVCMPNGMANESFTAMIKRLGSIMPAIFDLLYRK